ncbi:MAG TPA: hypothetical protein PLY93_12815, partial [Turneriella sp.]|nr:hypothetical protein [Turneriella sp.]
QTIGSAYYRSYWYTDTKSSVSNTFTFTEQFNGDDGGGAYAYRAMNMLMFKDYLFINMGTEQGGGGRGGRICMNPSGCPAGVQFSYVSLPNMYYATRIGALFTPTGGALRNGSFKSNTTGYHGTGADDGILNAINVMYEYDNDGVGGNESQLYFANGGYYSGALTGPRVTNSDGGVIRTKLAYSSKTSLPPNCPNDSTGCVAYYEDITPDAKAEWYKYLSIPYPQNSSASWVDANSDGINDNCASTLVEMNCTLPYNIFVPALKAIPYMRTAPNGDLYMLRNACSTTALNRNGVAGRDFRTEKQVCPKGSEVPQLWMLPKGTTGSPKGAADWVLVAQNGVTNKTNMAGNNAIGANT